MYSAAKAACCLTQQGIRSQCAWCEHAQVNHQYAQATGLAQQLRGKLADLQRISQQLDGVWRMQALRESGAKTDMWKRKVEQVSEEADDLSAALDKHTHRVRRWVHACGFPALSLVAEHGVQQGLCAVDTPS
jgi:Golgi SNAP receptor complex protein 2